MKKTFSMRTIAMVMTTMAFTVTSCGNGNNSKTEEPNNEQGTVEAVETQKEETPVLTTTGIGIIQKGIAISQLPDAVQGLYDKKEYEEFENEMDDFTERTLHFYLAGEEVIKAWVGEDKTVGGVTLVNPTFKTEEGITVGAPVQTIIDMKPQWTYYCDGTLYAISKGLMYSFNYEDLTQSGLERGEAGATSFGKPSDFKKTAAITAIGTVSE